MEARNLNLLDYAYRAYKRIGSSGGEDAFDEMRLFERIMRPDRPPVRLLGLFDTVASVIESGRTLPRLRSHAHTRNNSSVEAVRHAVAISDRRTMFRPQLWAEGQIFSANKFDDTDGTPQDFKEVWFAGVHGDIGGGYPEEEAGLAKIPLHWMIEETKDFGLLYKTRTVNELVLGKADHGKYVSPDPTSDEHDSMSVGWRLLEFVPRRKPSDSTRRDVLGWIIPRMEPRRIPLGSRIHHSVFEGDRKPGNLPEEHIVDGE